MKNDTGNEKVVTRFAPSPTGYLHIGGVRTALFSYLFARRNGGRFLLRIENTDMARNKKEYENDIIKGFQTLGLTWDNEPVYRQSEQKALYRKLLEKLVAEDKAYVSRETPEEEGERSEVIRLRNANKIVAFNDLVHGEISIDTTDLKDFVIAKSFDEPVFHFANIVDDHEMGISHVIRGEEHLSNTPRQILIQEALGFGQPRYAHIPLVLAPDRSKLSKRQGSVALKEFLEKGYLPEGLINYLALLGWHPEGNREIFTMAELIESFDLRRIQKGGAIWSTEKLDWVNREHLKKVPDVTFVISKKVAEILKLDDNDKNKKILERLSPIILERISKFGDIAEMRDSGELGYFFANQTFQPAELLWKGKGELAKVKERLLGVAGIISEISEMSFSKESVKEKVWPYAESEGRGEVLWPFRFALSGREKSPDPFVLSEILGKQETEKRLRAAANLIS